MIFLTGATGFLGAHLLEMLVSSGKFVHCLKRSTSNLDRVSHIKHNVQWVDLANNDFDKYFKHHQINCVIHCATNYGRNQSDPIEIVNVNLQLPLQLLHASIKNNVKIFINTDTILDKRINSYSLSKKHFSEWLMSYANNITAVNIALEHFYGPNDNSSKFVTFLLHELLKNAQSINLTAGEQKRDFIYIEDVVSAFKIILENTHNLSAGYHHFEVGTGRSIQIRELATLLKRITQNNSTALNFGTIPYRENECMDSTVNIKKLTTMGWKPQHSLEDGLIKTVKLEKSLHWGNK